MPKMKTHKGAAKRFKVTGTGKIKRVSSHNAHKFSAKSASQKRRLNQHAVMAEADVARIKKMLPYKF